MADPTPNPEPAESSKGNQFRTFVGWFSRMMKRSRNRMPRQMPSEESPQTGTPPTKAAPSNEQRSTMSLGQRLKVSMLSFSRW